MTRDRRSTQTILEEISTDSEMITISNVLRDSLKGERYRATSKYTLSSNGTKTFTVTNNASNKVVIDIETRASAAINLSTTRNVSVDTAGTELSFGNIDVPSQQSEETDEPVTTTVDSTVSGGYGGQELRVFKDGEPDTATYVLEPDATLHISTEHDSNQADVCSRYRSRRRRR